jgi:endonuclease/exonuclease/phosphatase family metal-dependent hydrolase
MNTENLESPTRRYGTYLLIGFMLCIGFVLGWFAVVRLSSPWTVVKSLTLSQEPVETPQKPNTVLRVGCYNIAHGRGGQLGATNWDGGSRTNKITRLKQIGQLLRDAQLEIVVLNEVDFSSIWSGHLDQATLIAKEGGYPYVLEQRNLNMAIPFVSVRFGNAILSKYPITDFTFLDYPNPSEVIEVFSGGYKEGVVATVTLPDTSQIRVAAIHLCVSSEPIRVASARMLLDVQRQSSVPMILMGDFNTVLTGNPHPHPDKREQNAIELLLDSPQITTKLPGLPIPPEFFTFPSEQPARVIDWIFVSSAWQIQDVRVIQTPLSDHLPVTAILTNRQSP